VKNLQRGFVIPLVIAIISVLVIGGGVYYSKNKSTADQAITDKNQTNSTHNNELSDWKTHKDNQYGFEFKYPSNWSLEKIDQGGFQGWVFRNYPDYGFYLGIIHHPYTQGIESGVNDNKKLTQIAGHKALSGGTSEYVITSPPTQDSVYAEIETESYSPSAHMITLSMSSNNHTKEMRLIFSQILSSFKFTK